MRNPSANILYQQVTDDLLDRLGGEQYEPGSMLPSEAVLCAEYGVSRITIRSAIGKLVERGLLVRKRGVGTFVTGRPSSSREFNLVGFMEEARLFTSQPVFSASEKADERIAAVLGIEVGSGIRHIQSIVHREGEPLTVTDGFSLDTPDRRIVEEDHARSVPSATAMGIRIRRKVERAEQELDAVAATGDVAQHLGLAEGTPIIRARRVYFASNDQPIYYLEVRYHPSRYRFNVDLVLRDSVSGFGVMPDHTTSAEPG